MDVPTCNGETFFHDGKSFLVRFSLFPYIIYDLREVQVKALPASGGTMVFDTQYTTSMLGDKVWWHAGPQYQSLVVPRRRNRSKQREDSFRLRTFVAPGRSSSDFSAIKQTTLVLGCFSPSSWVKVSQHLRIKLRLSLGRERNSSYSSHVQSGASLVSQFGRQVNNA